MVSVFDCFCHHKHHKQSIHPLIQSALGGVLFDKKRLVSGERVVTVIKGRPCPHYYFSHCGQQCAAFQSTLICSPARHAGHGLAPSSPPDARCGKYQIGLLPLHRPYNHSCIHNRRQHNGTVSTGGYVDLLTVGH